MKSAFEEFVAYSSKLRGDEKGEAQIFLDRFFTALGYPEGLKGAGAELEFRLRDETKRSTSFADLVWPRRVLIEMKKKDENLETHLQQASSYWIKLAGNRPRYVVLCNFDEFWIYDFDQSIYEPADKVATAALADRYQAFNFLLPHPKKPLFGLNLKDVTAKAAEKVAAMFNNMVKRGVPREDALLYSLQCVVSMFAEDAELLPEKIFSQIIEELDSEKLAMPDDKVSKSYDLIGELFHEMNRQGITEGGRYKGVDYFNGGLFKKVTKLELTQREVEMLSFASHHNWRNVNPAIFGSLFESGLEKGERHILGAHYTHEVDIKKIVDPVIVQPWMEKIEAAETLDDYYDLLWALTEYKVLDPACGSGNFLFIAFRELKMIERKLLQLVRDHSPKREDGQRLHKFLMDYPFVSTKQFYGIDIKPNAVELAKVTLMVAKELSYLDSKEQTDNKDKPLPLDNLDENIICADALLHGDHPRQWPEVDAIIGNPPYQSKNKMQQEFGAEYVNKLRSAYPEVPGRADFCVYWFYKAHNHLKEGQYAGLVGTNTIRQNYSREGSLDHIVKNGGTIFNAVSTEPWQGDAVVHVSIANWKKGSYEGNRILYITDNKGNYFSQEMPVINSSLSLKTDTSAAVEIRANKEPKSCYQGQTHGHQGFLLEKKEGLKLIKAHPEYTEVLKPLLIGDELVADKNSQPDRFVIDFSLMDVNEASKFKELFKQIEKAVLPDRKKRGEEQQKENDRILKKNPKAKVNKHHINFLNNWWKLSYGREDMLNAIEGIERFISCSRVSSRPIFEFVDSGIRPNDALMVFPFEDYYSFGVIVSRAHVEWYQEKASTMKGDPRYTANSIWDTFPWPQTPTEKQVKAVAEAAMKLHQERTRTLRENGRTLRDLYRILEQPGKNPIKDLHAALDKAVLEAYGFDPKQDVLAQLLALNLAVAAKEEKGEPVQAPGWPAHIPGREQFVTDDCVKFEG